MAQVDIVVNGHTFKVTCENGQEDRLHDLSRYLDAHIAALVKDLGQIGEARLMLLAGLTICDELFELRDKTSTGNAAASGGTTGEVNDILDTARDRIEAMQARLSTAR